MKKLTEMEKQVSNYLNTIRILSESTDDYLYVWDFQSGKICFGGEIGEKYQLPPSEEGVYSIAEWAEAVYERDLPPVMKDLERVQSGECDVHDMEYRLKGRNGRNIWISCRGKVQRDNEGRPALLIGRVSESGMYRKADPLTGLLNFTVFNQDMEETLSLCQEGYLLLLGVDNLQHTNIKHGRTAGDELLRRVSGVLEREVDVNIRIYRMEGDRFGINLCGWEKRQVEALYGKIKSALKGCCTLSAGAAAYSDAVRKDGRILYQYAESALGQAKEFGKNILIFFSPGEYRNRLNHISLLDEMRQSIQNDFRGFSLHYQPQVDGRTCRLSGAEALLRYDSPVQGRVSPGDFIPLLEQSRLICAVGRWVLENALQQCRIWRTCIPDFTISVNISYTQLEEKEIAGEVLELFRKSGLPGNALTLEVTESIQLQDYTYFNKIFYRWKKEGIRISVDDFGTGYSSLAYLKNIEVDEIKTDRCFVSGIQHSAYNCHLLKNVIDLAHSEQISICCEGVETEEEFQTLQSLGPELMQGYFFARPCSCEEFEKAYILGKKSVFEERSAEPAGHRNREEERVGREQGEDVAVIVDNMDEAVYISDVDTCELYYLNPAGRSLTGVYDYKGQKCYKVLQGFDAPCSFCTNNKLKDRGFYVWERKNVFLNRHFILKDKLVSWHGKRARMEIAIDVTEKEIVSQSVRKKLDFERNVVACIRALADNRNIEEAVRSVLEVTGRFYHADRAYVLEMCRDNDDWVKTYEWCDEGIVPQRTGRIDGARWRRALGTPDMEKQQTVLLENTDILREKYREEWERLQEAGISRLIAAPVSWEGRLSGYLVVDNPGYKYREDDQLQMMAFFLAERLHRKDTEERLGELLNCHYEDILQITKLGLWVIRIDEAAGKYEMFADRTMQHIMGLEEKISPEECYRHWYSRINDGYYHYVNLAVENMIHTRKLVQLEYTWEHPKEGQVMVRCLGCRGRSRDGSIWLEGYHRIISDIEKPGFFPDGSNSETFEFNEKRGSIYFHSGRKSLAGGAKQEEDFPECWIRDEMVHPHFADIFRGLFQNVQRQEDITGTELLLKTKAGNFEWFQLKTHHLGWQEQDIDTILVLLEPASRQRAMELEYSRQSDFYQAILSEAVAYVEVDLESGALISFGGLWEPYAEECRQEQKGFDQAIKRYIREAVPEEELMPYGEVLNTEYMKKLYKQGERTKKLCFRHKLKGRLNWVELAVHLFQDRYTENMYALLYLKDIDMEKRRELAREEAATRDSLTGLLNRRSFEREVAGYMTESGDDRRGALLMFDLDDFKKINDNYGHLGGDVALKRLGKALASVFRRGDILGRLGGDEFVVFIKGESDVSILARRLDDFFQYLDKDTEIPFTCSVGVALADSKNFSYEKSMEQADKALYRSKRQGKNQYSFFP